MEEQLISFELATLAKEKGLDIPCVQYYTQEYSKESILTTGTEYDSERDCIHNWNDNNPPYPNTRKKGQCSAVSLSLLAAWLRKNHKIEVYVQTEFVGALYQYVIKWHDLAHIEQYGSGNKSYEKAYDKGLIEALNKIK